MRATKFIALGAINLVALTQAIRVFMKSSILAHKLDLKCSHAADVDLLGVEYL